MKKNLLVCFVVLAVFVLFSTASAVPTDGLVAHYPFNGNADDESGNGYHGTIHGAVTWTEDRFDNAASACEFDGAADIEVPGNSDFAEIEDTDQITISAWIDIQRWDQTWFPIVDKYDETSLFGWIFQVNLDSGLNFVRLGEGYSCDFTPRPLEADHVVMTSDAAAGKLRFYVNGSLRREFDVAFDIPSTGDSLYIGYSPSGALEYADGVIDDLRIYKRALSGGEVMQLYREGVCEPDVNGDGAVNALDVMARRNQLFQAAQVWRQACYLPHNPCGDVNDDGAIDDTDLNLMVQSKVRAFNVWKLKCFSPGNFLVMRLCDWYGNVWNLEYTAPGIVVGTMETVLCANYEVAGTIDGDYILLEADIYESQAMCADWYVYEGNFTMDPFVISGDWFDSLGNSGMFTMSPCD